jgi:PAS domain S-box-containing protein
MRTLWSKGETHSCGSTIPLGCRLTGLIVLIAFVLAVIATGCFAAEPDTTKNVLVLESFSGYSGDFVTLLKPELRARVASPVDYYVENLESQRFRESGYLTSLAETLHSSYSTRKLDLVIVANYPALQFAVTYRERMFPGVPIVFLAVEINRFKRQKRWPNVTGVTASVDIQATIDLALHLHPGANTIAVISNTSSEFEAYWLAAVQAELQRQRGRVQELDLVGLPTAQLLQKVAALPPRSIVLVQLTPQESVQPVIKNDDVVMAIARLQPTYCIAAPFCMNRGGIGTADFDEKEQVLLAADMAARILAGERPDNIPVANGTVHQVLVDWRQLRRWNIAESALPPGSLVLHREPTFWERDRKYLIAAFVLIVAQFLMIVGLLWQRARRRKAEAVLQESEKRFRVMAETTPSLIWMCDKEGKITYLNSRRFEFTGPDPNAGYGDTWKEYLHPDDLKDMLPVVRQALKTPASYSNQYRLRRYDGVYRWMLDVATPRVNGDGSFAGFIGLAVDVTEQKLAQEGLENLSGRLIEAQERERSRIARDLHDDICQRLALVSVELAQATRDGFPPAMKERLEEMRQQCSEIAGDLQSLSHQLHSSKLDYLESWRPSRASAGSSASSITLTLSSETRTCRRICERTSHSAFSELLRKRCRMR